ncbi:MAG: hypothetical protein EB085_06500 [Betaproteobacteria bacterium]|nr:hypothetical protein [Betaproteobacteria bacterium]
MKKFLIPLVLFFGLVGFLAVGLNRDPREIPSPLVGKPAPAFELYTLDANAPKFGPSDVPETYVIDKEGVIRYKRVGVVTPDLLQSTILPLVQKLNAS